MNKKSSSNIRSYLSKKDYSYKKELLDYLKKDLYDFNEKILYSLLIIIIDNNLNFNNALNYAKDLYDFIVFDEKNEEEISIFIKIFSNYNDTSDLRYIEKIYPLFEDKKFLSFVLNKLQDMEEEKIDYIIKYIKEARKYYTEEVMFFSSLMELIDTVKENITVKDIIDKAIKNDMMQAGVYSFDEEKLSEIDSIMEELLDKSVLLDSSIEKDLKTLTEIEKELESFDSKEKLEKIEERLERQEQTKSDKSDVILQKLDILLDSIKSDKIVPDKNPEKTSNEDNKNSNTNITNNSTSASNNELLDFTIEVIIGKIKRDIISNKYNFEDLKKVEAVDSTFKEYLKNSFILKGDNSTTLLENLNISPYNLRYLSSLYFSLYNDVGNLFHKLIQNGVELRCLKLYYLDKKNVSRFNEEKYIELISNHYSFIDMFFENEDIDTLIKLLELNQYVFNYKQLDYQKLKEAIEVFGIEDVALRTEKIDAILNGNPSSYFEFLKGLYDIDENFYLNNDLPLRKIKIIYTPEEFSKITKEHQDAMVNVLDELYTDLIEENKELLRSLLNVSVEELEYSKYAYDILRSEKTSITVDEYLSLTLEEKKRFTNEYSVLVQMYYGSKTLIPRLKRWESKYKKR